MTYAYFLGIEFRIGQWAVADAETYLFAGIVTGQSESDFSVCRVFLRISQSADQCLNEPSGIGCDGLRLDMGIEIYFYGFLIAHAGHIDSVITECHSIIFLYLELHHVGFQTRQVQYVINQLHQFFGIFLDDGREFFSCVLVHIRF